jgi:hypothetical protein
MVTFRTRIDVKTGLARIVIEPLPGGCSQLQCWGLYFRNGIGFTTVPADAPIRIDRQEIRAPQGTTLVSMAEEAIRIVGWAKELLVNAMDDEQLADFNAEMGRIRTARAWLSQRVREASRRKGLLKDRVIRLTERDRGRTLGDILKHGARS